MLKYFSNCNKSRELSIPTLFALNGNQPHFQLLQLVPKRLQSAVMSLIRNLERHYITQSGCMTDTWETISIQFSCDLIDWTLLSTDLIYGLRPANERQCYIVTTSLIGWMEA